MELHVEIYPLATTQFRNRDGQAGDLPQADPQTLPRGSLARINHSTVLGTQ